MSNARRWYVYVHFRPWNGVPCYVGKGTKHRWLEHERLGESHYNKHFAAILRKAGGSLPKVKVRENLSEAEALETEIALIAAIGRGKKGPLVNWTDGGDGTSGYKHSEAAKARIAEAVSRREIKDSTRAKLRAANLGKTGAKHSDAFKEKIRRLHKGRVKSPEECAAISRGKMGHKVSAATREKIGIANAAYYATNPKTDAQKQATSLAVKSSLKTQARIIPVPATAIEEALAGELSIVAIAKKYNVGRRLLNDRVLAIRRSA